MRAIMLLPFLAIATSCGGGGSPATPEATDAANEQSQVRALPSDDDIISKVYDPNYSVPNGFFVDERANTAQSYTVHHVMDDSSSYELCTDNYAVAEAWESADNDARSVSGYYVGAYENDRYYEFIRELSYDDDVGNIGDLTSPGFSRVFKCSNTYRDGVDRSLLSGYAGKLNTRPLTQNSVRDFAEYFWQFTFFTQRHKKVLDSYSDYSTDGPNQTLRLAFASAQGNGRCDLIEVIEWRFVADNVSGEITSQFSPLKSFEAELVDGSPQLCQ
ncbi:MAG: hypothetical protein OER97_06040 [Gammaproteobacteria bacterium]|nr:hypothetical protein [Gammaproteobacteria bacterium]